MQFSISISNNWVAPIEVPGYGIVFPQRGLQAIPEGAIAYLLALGYLISLELNKAIPEEIKPEIRRKPKIVESPNLE